MLNKTYNNLYNSPKDFHNYHQLRLISKPVNNVTYFKNFVTQLS